MADEPWGGLGQEQYTRVLARGARRVDMATLQEWIQNSRARLRAAKQELAEAEVDFYTIMLEYETRLDREERDERERQERAEAASGKP